MGAFAMAREFDHLVHCVHDLETAHQRFRSLGFTVRPPAVLPFGVRNRVVLLENAFIELLTIDDPGAIPPATPGNFSFGAHNQAFLAAGEGLSMLAFKGTDAPADARAFAARGLGSYASFDFSRDAVLADGCKVRAAFSLAFAIDPALPRLAFFTCHHHLPRRDLFLQPDYLRHANGAKHVVEVILSVPDPAAHRDFLERLTESGAIAVAGGLSFGPLGDRLTLLRQDGLAEPRFAAYRLGAADLGVVERQLRDGGIPYRTADSCIVVAPADAFGVAIEFAASAGG
jgi:hypothetical protein